MRNILILGQSSFVADLEVTVLTEEIEDLEFGFASSVEKAVALLDNGSWDEFIIFAGFLESIDLSTIDVPVTSYARNANGLDIASKERIKSYGIVNRASELLKNIRSGAILSFEAPESPETTDNPEIETQSANEEKTSQKPDLSVSAHDAPMRNKEKKQISRQVKPVPHEDPEDEWLQEEYEETPAFEEQILEKPRKTVRPAQRRQPDNDVRSRLMEIRRQREEEEAGSRNEQIEEFQEEEDTKAQVITVYSAKGGVGKTTIACNLATLLALTAAGRDRYRVAIIDFNIDFGDVMSTLGFDSDKICMTTWAHDIKERIADGEEPDDIFYTEREIRSFMQKNQDSGLYALLAPLTNEDSMDIDEEEIRIMLKNTVENGGFDFVVIDTGNNTRDSAVIPIEASDHVLIVLTQSVNTANCCYGFIKVMYELGYDMSKMKTVINEVRPGKAVGISVSELEEVLVNPSTGEPFKCIGKIDDDNDVRASVNDMIPLVYRSNHEYTRSISRIVAAIIGDEHVLETPKKKSGFFAKLFGKG